jgi:hypothetical protein
MTLQNNALDTEKSFQLICLLHFLTTFLNRKMQALDGNLMTLFLMEVIDDAIQHIESHGESEDPALLLRQLQEQEDAEYQIFLNSGPPLLGRYLFSKDAPIPTDVSVETIYRGPNICHTARLPSQTRYLGILTNKYNQSDNGETAMIHPYNFDKDASSQTEPYNYDIGLAATDAASTPNPDGEMRLVYAAHERHRCAPLVYNDYKDWFMAQGADDPQQASSKLVLPNAAEKAAYMTQPQQEPLKGIIALCFTACAWGKFAVFQISAVQRSTSIRLLRQSNALHTKALIIRFHTLSLSP